MGLRVQSSVALGVGLTVALVYSATAAPSVYTLDSAEFVTAAYTLGIPHAPSYPLYTLLLHFFLQLPTDDVARLGNLFSVLVAALSACAAMWGLARLVQPFWIAPLVVLGVAFSYHVWLVALSAEIYPLQTFALILQFAVLVAAQRYPQDRRWAILTGLVVGLSVAVHPANALTGLGVLWALRCAGASRVILAGLLAAAVFVASYAYLPIRYQVGAVYNTVGTYDEHGVFHPVPLDQLEGLLWVLTGRQFASLFPEWSTLLTGQHLLETALFLIRDTLGVGFGVALLGLIDLWQKQRSMWWLWTLTVGPFALFYAHYQVGDKFLMLSPFVALLGYPMAVGWQRLTAFAWGKALLWAWPVLLLVIHYPIVDLSRTRDIREHAEAQLLAAPPEAVLIGNWVTITPLEYLQHVEGLRPDVRLYNTFLFESPQALQRFYTNQRARGVPIDLLPDPE